MFYPNWIKRLRLRFCLTFLRTLIMLVQTSIWWHHHNREPQTTIQLTNALSAQPGMSVYMPNCQCEIVNVVKVDIWPAPSSMLCCHSITLIRCC
ncbi:hypothetical protein B0T09DRAFT_39409 [Sordaria sp. MPI-SDFR-AT-0083]|nr:hypothetical protein B0T09DRAFT_39409 [Sordaria sp. MPI-SDFR-AT-0083]